MNHDINEMARQIFQRREEIKDEFCKAYLAENMISDVPIKDLVLNEQFKDGTYRWWFSVKDEEYMK
jgi:hypothetical protein